MVTGKGFAHMERRLNPCAAENLLAEQQRGRTEIRRGGSFLSFAFGAPGLVGEVEGWRLPGSGLCICLQRNVLLLNFICGFRAFGFKNPVYCSSWPLAYLSNSEKHFPAQHQFLLH